MVTALRWQVYHTAAKENLGWAGLSWAITSKLSCVKTMCHYSIWTCFYLGIRSQHMERNRSEGMVTPPVTRVLWKAWQMDR
jgi:hypothetical protein